MRYLTASLGEPLGDIFTSPSEGDFSLVWWESVLIAVDLLKIVSLARDLGKPLGINRDDGRMEDFPVSPGLTHLSG